MEDAGEEEAADENGTSAQMCGMGWGEGRVAHVCFQEWRVRLCHQQERTMPSCLVCWRLPDCITEHLRHKRFH